MRNIILVCFIFFSGFLFAVEYTVNTVPNPKTNDATNFVSNPDGILNTQTVYQINGVLQSLDSETKAEVAVVAVNSIGYADIKDFATKLFQEWGVGKKGADNGLLILFVLDQRKITFETGYGIEGILPDAICKRIQQQTMLPHFRDGDYDAGFIAGVDQVASILREEVIDVPQETIDWQAIIPIVLGIYLVFAFLVFVWVNRIAVGIKKNTKYETNNVRYIAFKNQKAGVIPTTAFFLPVIAIIIVVFFINPVYGIFIIPVPLLSLPAFFYGKVQLLKFRRQSFPCSSCNDGVMRILSERKEDKYLTPSQQLEEKLGSMDYDVFLCDKCQKYEVFPYDRKSRYTKCPKCGTKSFILHSRLTLVAPSYSSAGTEQQTYKCLYCGHQQKTNKELPRLQRSSGVAGGMAAGSILGGGGRSSGGFGGGGSFGGGHSGGGGATSGW